MEDHIFHFNDRGTLQLQDDGICEALLEDFWTRILNSHEDLRLPKEQLSRVKRSCSSYNWLARYASVVIVRLLDSKYSTMTLVGLDGWKSHVHASVAAGRQTTALPDVSSPTIYELGPLSTDVIKELMQKFRQALLKSEENNTGNSRGQRPGHQGHQKTPSFARTVLWQIASESDNPLPIQGGTTDVGPHTGSVLRNTTFPLVLSTFHTLLLVDGEGTDQVFYKCVSAYLVTYLSELASHILVYDARKIDRVITAMREIEAFVKLVEDVDFVDVVVRIIEDYHKNLLDIRPGGNAESSTALCLDSVESMRRSLRAPRFPTIPDFACIAQTQTMDQTKADAKQNLGWSNLSSPNFTGRLQDSLVHVARMNEFFWTIATQLDDVGVSQDGSVLRTKLALFSQHVALISKQSLQTSHVMTVVLTSNELLAIWICSCWAHRTAEEKNPLFQKYGAALDPADLQHIALEDARAITAVNCVRTFLEPRFALPCKPFRKPKDTCILALDYGLSSQPFCNLHAEELRAANDQIQMRWDGIVRTQQQLRVLDSELRDAKHELRNATSLRKESELVDFDWVRRKKVFQTVYYEKVDAESHCQNVVASLKNQIQNLEQKPSDFTLGLPRDKDLCLQWLFFLFIPIEFRNLAALVQLAESKLWKKAPAAKSATQDLLGWFTCHRKVSSAAPTLVEMRLLSHTPLPRIDTPGIRSYTRETGVFFPDYFCIDPTWDGTDPFSDVRRRIETAELFTERLPNDIDQREFMQQFVAMLPTKTRENQSIAHRERKPEWLTQEQYGAFSSLRAGPYAQIRCLVEALLGNLLPFHNRGVHILVKQVLFHIGENGWKIDLDENHQGLVRISTQMRREAKLMRESPKDCDRLLLFGILSSFFGQNDLKCQKCAHEFACLSRRWAESVSEEVSHFEHVSPALYWKQAKFYGYSLLCYSLGDLDDTDFLELAELIVLFRSKAAYASDDESSRSLDHPILQVMTSRLDGILGAVMRDLNHLTNCLRLFLHKIPPDLIWSPVLYNNVETGCFQAESDHLYSINVLNGTVLVDGVPPGLLPISVIEDPLYHRTFGERNFEIVVLGFRHYRAARPVDGGFLYEFVVDATGMLHITENDSSDHRLILLRHKELDLPPILCERHSHWYSEKHKMVFLRGPSYRERIINFVMTGLGTYSLPVQCREAPLQDVVDILPTCDQLLLGPTTLSRMLSSFEDDVYIHQTVNPTWDTFRFNLPRYKLSFELKDNSVTSGQFRGFCMQDSSMMDDTLPKLKSYIALSHPDGREMVLIREGKIHADSSIEIKKDWCAAIDYHMFDIHRRFRHLIAVDTTGRLHLAGLYASTGSLIADRRMGKQGSAVATELVRQCWKNEPLTGTELSKLVEVRSHSNLSCTLSLVCTWVWRSSNSVAFLHGCQGLPEQVELGLDLLAMEEYRRNPFAPRLLACEERTLLGIQQPQRNVIELPHNYHSETIQFVLETEEGMRNRYVAGRQRRCGYFPLQRPSDCMGLQLKVYEDIEESYEIFRRLPVKESRQLDVGNLNEIKEGVLERRVELETSILRTLLKGDQSSQHRFSQLCGRVGIAGSLDVLCLVFDDSIANHYNPFLEGGARLQLRLKSIDWAVLCVLEDKLHRILAMRLDKNAQALVAELECIRTWKPAKHVRWLAFEVEQQAQIRPHQFAVVEQLQKNPGSVIQLNMGLGKTRILVPMLILDLMPSESIARVNMLSSIVGEALAYFRKSLVSSVQHVKIFSLPFSRDIPLDGMIANQLSDEIARCREHFGCLVVTPQHRNSLLLKQHDQDVFIDGLKASFVDILDESDAILSHEFQLVYALGAQVPLPSGPCRWTVLQSLLVILARSTNEALSNILNDPLLVHRDDCASGSFPRIRLLLPFKSQGSHSQKLITALCRQLLADPPYELKWMGELSSEEVELLVPIMVDPEVGDSLNQICSNPLFHKMQSDILAVRGFLAYGIVIHGLEARYRVDYGLNASSQTKMAVPYSASDTPKERAQYSHPDMELVYTALSYFHEGLTKLQLKASLERLQTMGPVAQETIYGEWIISVRSDVPNEELVKFDDILKVDVNNEPQQCLIYKHLRNCMGVICFWTNSFVFRTDTYQFLSKRATNAWNLSDSGKAIGFSGTDDNRFLLPLSISQQTPEDEYIRATNGAMIRLILDCTKQLVLLNDATGCSSSTWQKVLDQSVSLGVHALIDVAGLMAGFQNIQAAHYLAERLNTSCFAGVVYFDTDAQSWFVYEMDNRRSLSLQSSSLMEAECFVFFDESRCRGSDMKLLDNAVALVTLEPKLTKDKFLQGCARMRKLGCERQTLILTGTSEVLSPESTTTKVLENILHHSAMMTTKDTLTYYQRGLHYLKFPKPIEDDMTLEAMYASDIPEFKDLEEHLDATHEYEEVPEKVEDLIKYCIEIGKGMSSCGVGQLSEDCEQEIENEEDEEEQAEVEIPLEDPFAQEDWHFPKAFSDPETLFQTFFLQVKLFIRHKLKRLSVIPWDDNLYCTPNYWRTINAANSSEDLSRYLRRANAMLVMRDGRVCLISAYELDKLLPEWWIASGSYHQREPKAILQQVITANEGVGFGRDVIIIPDKVMTFVKLFRGCVQFTDGQKQILADALRCVPEAHSVVQELLFMRGRLGYFSRSDLETIASKLRP